MRSKQILLLATLLPLSWLLMQVVHETGHILAAIATGGTVTHVVLHPLAISRTDVSPNPAPLTVVWAGPLLGTLLPLVIFALAHQAKSPIAFLLRFFAGFCAIANGLYIGVGSFAGIGDAGEMLHLGSPRWTLWLTGLLLVPLGFLLWNNQGSSFGLGQHPQPISPTVTWGIVTLFVIVVVLECLFSPIS